PVFHIAARIFQERLLSSWEPLPLLSGAWKYSSDAAASIAILLYRASSLITALTCNQQNSASAKQPPPRYDSSFLVGLPALHSASCDGLASVHRESLHVLTPARSSHIAVRITGAPLKQLGTSASAQWAWKYSSDAAASIAILLYRASFDNRLDVQPAKQRKCRATTAPIRHLVSRRTSLRCTRRLVMVSLQFIENSCMCSHRPGLPSPYVSPGAPLKQLGTSASAQWAWKYSSDAAASIAILLYRAAFRSTFPFLGFIGFFVWDNLTGTAQVLVIRQLMTEASTR
ncbi:hypothetical protein MTO96_047171, partial [Rhipicephalus appendiculatus]